MSVTILDLNFWTQQTFHDSLWSKEESYCITLSSLAVTANDFLQEYNIHVSIGDMSKYTTLSQDSVIISGIFSPFPGLKWQKYCWSNCWVCLQIKTFQSVSLSTTNHTYENANLNLYLLKWKIWWAPNNASKWQMGFNFAFKGLK